jgi:hypothetical protein
MNFERWARQKAPLFLYVGFTHTTQSPIGAFEGT